jgi:hypothetical protein
MSSDNNPWGRQASTWSIRKGGCEPRYRRPRKTPVTTNAKNTVAAQQGHEFALAA